MIKGDEWAEIMNLHNEICERADRLRVLIEAFSQDRGIHPTKFDNKSLSDILSLVNYYDCIRK